MKAAIVVEAGKTPIYGDFEDPIAGDFQRAGSGKWRSSGHGQRRRAELNLMKGRASGTHYSSSGHVPFVVGVDGVGRLDDGRRVYFVLPRAPFGSMSEKTAVRTSQCVFLPDDLDDITAAAIANPAMSSWAAFKDSEPNSRQGNRSL